MSLEERRAQRGETEYHVFDVLGSWKASVVLVIASQGGEDRRGRDEMRR